MINFRIITKKLNKTTTILQFKKLTHIELKSNRFNKISLGLLIILLHFNTHSQENQQNYQYSKYILLRGKATSFFIIEDMFWRNANIGAEFRLLDKHSIGIDYVFFRWRYENDSVVDGIEYTSGYESFSRRNYILLDYRYYPFRQLAENKGADLYLNPFVKIGERKVWSDNSTTYVGETDFYKISGHQSRFTDYGFALGLKGAFSPDNRFGIDANIGFVKRFSNISYEKGYDFSTNQGIEKFDVNESKWLIHMRLNLYFRIAILKK